jgi:hypothetical protein
MALPLTDYNACLSTCVFSEHTLIGISVRGWVNTKTMVRQEGSGELQKFIYLIATRIRNLLACSIMPQPAALPHAPLQIVLLFTFYEL